MSLPSQILPVERARSLTHEHLLSVIAGEFEGESQKRELNILDLGCGEGKMLAYLARNLPRAMPGMRITLYGLDVHDHGVQRRGYQENTIANLRTAAPGVEWKERVFCIASREAWPFPDSQFDFILSNQVMEHVHDHDFVFGETRRTLVDGGRASHLFPLKHYIYEGHLLLPWVHRIGNADIRVAYIRFLSRLGMGKYRGHKEAYGMTLAQFAEMHSDYMSFLTNYLSESEALDCAKRAGLRASFRYTQELYYRKLRDILRLSQTFKYSRRRREMADWVWVKLLRYVSGVTLFLEKKQTYVMPAKARGGA